MRPLRMVYWAGRGDVKNNFLCWSAGKSDDSITGVGYSELVFDLCTELGAPLLALTSHPNSCLARNDLIRVESIAPLFRGGSRLGYYGGHARAAALLGREARAFGADVVAITEEVSPTAVLPLRMLGLQLIQIRHCSLWPRLTSPSPRERLVWATHGLAYRLGFAGVLAVSATVARQVSDVAGDPAFPTREFLPLWRAASWNVPPPPEPRRPFRVLVAGRVIASKGVFDVLTLARELRARGHELAFEVCGDGSELSAARRRIDEEGLGDVVSLHGWCPPRELRERFARCHAVLVPTTPTFNEGFNKVVIEACLAQRPVVVSDICPAVEYVEPAVVAYRGGDLGSCREALIRLATDPELYSAKRAECLRVARPFLDARFSLREALRGVFSALQQRRGIEPRRILGTADFSAAQAGAEIGRGGPYAPPRAPSPSPLLET
ncbi:MAG TPA: glycosyltransferase family 4 protein [Polyangia bacterium]|nr:glycosyltransferase family 4 protein [Polyangia bacterium]